MTSTPVTNQKRTRPANTGGSTAESPVELDLQAANDRLADATPQDVIRWAVERFGTRLVMTSSFGTQAAVMLHLVTRVVPDIPVILIDTGYLFPETYRFVDDLTKKLELNLKVYQPLLTPARHEALEGRLWEKGPDAIDLYNRVRKVEPMQRALRELDAAAWLAGLRSQQTDHRAALRRVDVQDGVIKVHPILNWTGREVHQYLTEHDLPLHPLNEQGYMSIGDTHSSAPITADQHERAGRFSGLRQECGLHLPTTQEETASRDSSGL